MSIAKSLKSILHKGVSDGHLHRISDRYWEKIVRVLVNDSKFFKIAKI